MSEIRQGAIGDCWLLATLASIANFQPGAIKNIIKENPDGTTVDVTLQRELLSGVFRKETYTVEKSTFTTESGMHIMSKYPDSLWVQMIEKAFSAYFAKGQDSIDYNNIRGGGFGSRDAFKIILGKDARSPLIFIAIADFSRSLFSKIKSALDENVPIAYMSAGIRSMKDINGNSVYHNHVYSIIDAEESEGKYYLKLRNPWGYNVGNDHHVNDAIITVELKNVCRGLFEIANLRKPE